MCCLMLISTLTSPTAALDTSMRIQVRAWDQGTILQRAQGHQVM
uniref:Uncharacterized protein n=1 Tax=Arundo donax TaxID=35708 RepID=A0A0A9BFS0_ARUDO